MSSCPEPIPAAIPAAILDVKRALLALNFAKERLRLELPESLISELHYNGRNATIPEQYRAAVEILRTEP